MPSEVRAAVTGIVLAGGLARRMGGLDKGLQLLDGRPMVAWVVDRLAPQASAILINANRNAEAYAAFGAEVVGDRIGDFAGPLAGIHAGLCACSTPLLATVPCDAPRLPTDLVARLHDGLAASCADIAVARAGGRIQPVFALMHRSVLDGVENFLKDGGRSVGDWLASSAPAIVDFEDAEAFANINTPEELAAQSRPV